MSGPGTGTTINSAPLQDPPLFRGDVSGITPDLKPPTIPGEPGYSDPVIPPPQITPTPTPSPVIAAPAGPGSPPPGAVHYDQSSGWLDQYGNPVAAPSSTPISTPGQIAGQAGTIPRTSRPMSITSGRPMSIGGPSTAPPSSAFVSAINQYAAANPTFSTGKGGGS